MANFTPITTGAAANASIVNAPLYELDNAIITLQTSSAINAARPWSKIGGGVAQPTSSDPVYVTDAISHIGQLIRGDVAITSIGADMETRGNLAVGGGNHTMSGTGSIITGDNNNCSAYSLVGGQHNGLTGVASLGIGLGNLSAAGATIISGTGNQIVGSGSFNSSILGGVTSLMTNSPQCTIAGGGGNIINSASYSFIGGGSTNQITLSATYSGILAGQINWIYNGAANSAMGAGQQNVITDSNCFIGAGLLNNIATTNGFIGAGFANVVTGTYSGIVSGNNNTISGSITNALSSVIAGGSTNNITNTQRGIIGAGESNTISSANHSVIAGGFTNSIGPAGYAFIGAGNNNSISGAGNGFIGGGSSNTISGSGSTGAAIIAGFDNTNTGLNSTVLNGSNNVINEHSSVIGGVEGHITHTFAFLWNSWVGSTFSSASSAEFAVTAHGGVRIFTNSARSTGMTMAAGASSWSAVSARALKGEFKDIEPHSILDRLISVPIQSYRFKKQRQDETTKQMVDDGFHDHLNFGPVAEDWNSAFGDVLGEKTVLNVVDGKEIHMLAINEGDKLGVALAAIQCLADMFGELKTEIDSLKQRLPAATKTKTARGEV